jgi:iron complex transport system substrate-binding protein
MLPSATEIVSALGLFEDLVAVTYACDFPFGVSKKAIVVNTKLPSGLSSREIDRLVCEFSERGESLYNIDVNRLQQLDPDLIVTQELCDVCAAAPGDLRTVLEAFHPVPPIVSLNPHTLADVCNDIRAVGIATGRSEVAKDIVDRFWGQVAAVREQTRQYHRPRVVCLEWLDPPFVAGHWVPEMVHIAGGIDVLGRAGQPSFRTSWKAVVDSHPDVIVLIPCGY